ncbi:MAG: hypothetical protein AAF519_16310 [Bacteroidota bacterium]
MFDSVKLKEKEWPVSYVITPKKITDSLVTFTDLTSRNIIVFNKRGDHVKTVNNDLIKNGQLPGINFANYDIRNDTVYILYNYPPRIIKTDLQGYIHDTKVFNLGNKDMKAVFKGFFEYDPVRKIYLTSFWEGTERSRPDRYRHSKLLYIFDEAGHLIDTLGSHPPLYYSGDYVRSGVDKIVYSYPHVYHLNAVGPLIITIYNIVSKETEQIEVFSKFHDAKIYYQDHPQEMVPDHVLNFAVKDDQYYIFYVYYSDNRFPDGMDTDRINLIYVKGKTKLFDIEVIPQGKFNHSQHMLTHNVSDTIEFIIQPPDEEFTMFLKGVIQ